MSSRRLGVRRRASEKLWPTLSLYASGVGIEEAKASGQVDFQSDWRSIIGRHDGGLMIGLHV